LRREGEDKLVKSILILLFAIHAALGQTGTASVQGTVLDAKTQKPVPAAWVIAVRAGPPPFTRNTKSGGDGAFQIQGLTAGNYSLCVQVEGDQYLNMCQWNGNPTPVALTSTQAVSGILLKLTAASILTIQVQDPLKVLSQPTKEALPVFEWASLG